MIKLFVFEYNKVIIQFLYKWFAGRAVSVFAHVWKWSFSLPHLSVLLGCEVCVFREWDVWFTEHLEAGTVSSPHRWQRSLKLSGEGWSYRKEVKRKQILNSQQHFLHYVSLSHVSTAPHPARWGDPDVGCGTNPKASNLWPVGATAETQQQQKKKVQLASSYEKAQLFVA